MKKCRKNKIIKILICIFIIIIILLMILSLILYIQNKNKLEVILKNKLEAEINSEVVIKEFVKEVKNGKITNDNEKIDTSVLGKKKVVLLIDKKNKQLKYEFNINIVDTIKPEIIAKDDITIYLGDNIDLTKDIIVSDNSLEDIKIKIDGDYDLNKVGKYNLKYIASDSSNNETTYDFILNVIEDPNNKTFTTSKGYLAKIIDGVTYIDGILIVNKTYNLPSSYGTQLTDTTINSFNKMRSEASKLGLNLYISSGFRSYSLQNTIYNNYVNMDGKVNADTYSARAGHSEHQTGLAFDLNSINSSFADTQEGKWVNDNAYKYGFIIRYPKGKESITGYMYEPWHLRYVGTNLATKLYNSGNWISLEEYYGIDSKYE